jgi:hypothetical protein
MGSRVVERWFGVVCVGLRRAARLVIRQVARLRLEALHRPQGLH